MRIGIHLEARGASGNEIQSLLVARGLRDRGHDIQISCRPGGQVEERAIAAGLPVNHHRPTGDLDLLGAVALAAWLRRWRADAILLTSWKRAFTVGWAARRSGRARVVLRVGGVHPIRPGLKGWKYRHSLPRYMDAIVTNSAAVTRHLLEHVPGLTRESLYEVPNGIALKIGEPAPLPRELGLAGRTVLAAVAELSRRKGYDVLLRALAKLGDPDVHLVAAGEGPERERLEAICRELGLTDRVHWLGHRTDVGALLAAADIFVSASRAEGMAVAMLEAMTAGNPVIATDAGGVRDALEARAGRPPAGWITPVDDADTLARTIREVVAGHRSGDPQIDARRREARWRMENWFSVDQMLDGVEAALLGIPYRSVLAPTRL